VEPTVSGFKICFCFRAKYLTAANGASTCIYTHVHGTENQLGKTRKCCFIVSFNPVVEVFPIVTQTGNRAMEGAKLGRKQRYQGDLLSQAGLGYPKL